jgi:hypothetical protein
VRRLELIAAETAARKHKARAQAGTGIFRFPPDSAPVRRCSDCQTPTMYNASWLVAQ